MDFIVDFLIVAVFALCIFVGVKNGLIRSIIGLVVVAAAAALAVWLSEPVASGIYDLFIKKSLVINFFDFLRRTGFGTIQ